MSRGVCHWEVSLKSSFKIMAPMPGRRSGVGEMTAGVGTTVSVAVGTGNQTMVGVGAGVSVLVGTGV